MTDYMIMDDKPDVIDADYEYQKWLEKQKKRIDQIYEEIDNLEEKQNEAAEMEDQPRYLQLEAAINELDEERMTLLDKIKVKQPS